MFYGRESERKKLNTMFHSDGQKISLIYGRRRIGKSELIKQVLKGNNRLSMLLFDRGIEAFNLKYTIIVSEGPGSPIGVPLAESLIVSSEDTHELNGKTMKLEDMNNEA